MLSALALHALAEPILGQYIDGMLVELPSADTLFDLLSRTGFDDERSNAVVVQQLSKKKPRRTGTDDAHLHFFSAHDLAPVARSGFR